MSIGALQESNAPVILMLVSPFAGDRCFLGIKVENGESEMTLRRSSLFSYSPSRGWFSPQPLLALITADLEDKMQAHLYKPIQHHCQYLERITAIGFTSMSTESEGFYVLEQLLKSVLNCALVSANSLSTFRFDPSSSSAQVRYAFELLTNPIWKRDYDLFALDEHLSVLNDITKQYSGENYSKINLPLLDATSSGGKDLAFNVLTPEEFGSVLGGSKPLLIQVYSNGSYCCASFINNWKRIAGLLDGVADTGMVELGNIKLTAFFAERYSLKHPIFRNGNILIISDKPIRIIIEALIALRVVRAWQG